ncbi:hypothetical protein TL16_g06650 [Triparma laevis f. inornata]|uniref:Uncharacterized protein n=1 Tax=Triparma laevis f. inornata TaxID=1714386 RepID=A0A9W7EDU5_9STRA|nr:hypothetical protein TL16_g06650 [Triparma laevis f. inornata]
MSAPLDFVVGSVVASAPSLNPNLPSLSILTDTYHSLIANNSPLWKIVELAAFSQVNVKRNSTAKMILGIASAICATADYFEEEGRSNTFPTVFVEEGGKVEFLADSVGDYIRQTCGEKAADKGISVLAMFDLCVKLCDRFRADSLPLSAGGVERQFGERVLLSLTDLMRRMTIELNVRRKFDWLKGKNWLSESDGSNAWLLHLCLLWENERKEGSVLACAWNHDSISVHNYKHMVSCVAFVAKSCAHEGGRSRFESMEDEAVAALSMMPVKTDDKGDVAVSIAADSRVSLADIEAGLESITKSCKELASTGILKGYDGKTFGPCFTLPENAETLSKYYDTQIQMLLSTPSKTAFLVDGRTLINANSRNFMGHKFLMSKPTVPSRKEASPLVRFSTIMPADGSGPPAGTGPPQSQLGSDMRETMRSSGSLLHGVTGIFDLASSNIPSVNKFANASIPNTGGTKTPPFSLVRPGSNYNSIQGSPVSGQISMSVAHTPMTSALEQMDWALVISTAQPKPSPELMSYFEGNTINFDGIVKLVDVLLMRVSTNSTDDPKIVSMPPQPPSPDNHHNGGDSLNAVSPNSPAPLLFLHESGEMKVLPNGEFCDKVRRA